MVKKLKGTIISLILVIGVLFGSLVIFWLIRPVIAFNLNPYLEMEQITPVATRTDGLHNSNTDMIYWNGKFYVAFQSSKYHIGTTQSSIKIKTSIDDGQNWVLVKEFKIPDTEMRDPHLAVIGGRIFIYCLKNEGFIADPSITYYSYSDDGITWTDLEPINGVDGWLLWHPQSIDETTWYVGAYWHEHGRSALLKTTDGINWDLVSIIHEGDGNDETTIHFLDDGRILATIRAEHTADSAFGNIQAGTIIAVSESPFTTWATTKVMTDRFDGPSLVNASGYIFGVGRYHPEIDPILSQTASLMSTTRTAIYLVTENNLIYLTQLPSASDTSYAGTHIKDNYLYICYYTSDIRFDRPWVLGMLFPTEVKFIRVSVSSLLNMKDHPLPNNKSAPIAMYIVLGFANALSYFILRKRHIAQFKESIEEYQTNLNRK
jgi:hypothetical protein